MVVLWLGIVSLPKLDTEGVFVPPMAIVCGLHGKGQFWILLFL